MQSQIVLPANGLRERQWLLATVVAVLCACGLLIAERHAIARIERLRSYQISAFSDLRPGEQALFNDLYAAALELETARQDGGQWLPLAALQDQGIPPFAPGSAAGYAWSASALDDPNLPAIAYFGRSARPADARSFLLVMNQSDPLESRPHVHLNVLGLSSPHKQAYTAAIWVNAAASPAMPREFDPDSLAAAGWRQAMALKGDDAARGVTQAKAP